MELRRNDSSRVETTVKDAVLLLPSLKPKGNDSDDHAYNQGGRVIERTEDQTNAAHTPVYRHTSCRGLQFKTGSVHSAAKTLVRTFDADLCRASTARPAPFATRGETTGIHASPRLGAGLGPAVAILSSRKGCASMLKESQSRPRTRFWLWSHVLFIIAMVVFGLWRSDYQFMAMMVTLMLASMIHLVTHNRPTGWPRVAYWSLLTISMLLLVVRVVEQVRQSS